MKSKLFLTASAVLLSIFIFAQEPKPVPGQYIVILKESAASPIIKKQKKNNDREKKFNENKPERDKNLAKVKAVQNKKNIKSASVLNEYADVVVGFSAKLTDSEKNALQSDNEVEGVYQDYYFDLGPVVVEANPSGTGYNKSPIINEENELAYSLSGPNWHTGIDNTANNQVNDAKAMAFAQTVPCGITKAGGFIDGSAKGTWIWILDTGINLSHPDLNVQTSSTFAKSFVPGQTVEDGHGHGTHVAGTAAAKNNSIGVVGVSAGARVVPVKVLPNAGSGQWSWLLAALNHVAQYDIPGDVINMSLGGYGYGGCENSWGALRDAIRNLGLSGTYVVMAAGNDNADAAMNRPGCINGTRVYTVGGMSCSNTCYGNSNWNTSSSVPVDWVAVGVSVYSTYKGGGYATMSGTSMAPPHVAGIIHARNGPPISAGTISCKGKSYAIARR
jgi:subtilisin family serine protease